MKEKLLQFFTGKMSKTIYISIVSAVVCGAVVITSTVIVHNNNQKIDSVLESLTATESVAELSSENAIESVSDTGNTDSGAQAKAPNGEPTGDKALQYLAEYNTLTKEYEKNRTELEKQIYEVPKKGVKQQSYGVKPERQIYYGTPEESEDAIAKKQKEYDERYERELKEWEKESQIIEQANKAEAAKVENEYVSEKAKVAEAQRKLDALDAQYEKDVAALKARYGIA